jgi:hypothetical protein
MTHRARVVVLLAFASVLACSQGPARAQVVKPFKITGGGPVPDGLSLIPGVPAAHYATGQATELGRYSCVGMFTLLQFTGQFTAEFSSKPYCIFTAANGDVLAMTYGDVGNHAAGPGEVTLTPVGDGSVTAVFIAEFNPVPTKCTGRFAKLTGGSFIMTAKSEPFFLGTDRTTPFNYTWEGEGSLEFRTGK